MCLHSTTVATSGNLKRWVSSLRITCSYRIVSTLLRIRDVPFVWVVKMHKYIQIPQITSVSHLDKHLASIKNYTKYTKKSLHNDFTKQTSKTQPRQNTNSKTQPHQNSVENNTFLESPRHSTRRVSSPGSASPARSCKISFHTVAERTACSETILCWLTNFWFKGVTWL